MSGNKTIKIYKIKNWKMGSELEQGKNGRSIAKLILGEIYEGKDIIDYIIEDIYKDLLDDIYNNPRNYEVVIKLNMVPQLTVIYDGLLISHNDNINDYIDTIKETLTNIQNEYVLDAYLEMRLNMNGKNKLKESTDMLAAMIRKTSGFNYSIPFIRTAICQIIEDKFFNTRNNELKEWIRSLSYQDLVEYTNELIRYKMTNSIKNEFLFEYINNSAKDPKRILKDFENILSQELILRLHKGLLAEKK